MQSNQQSIEMHPSRWGDPARAQSLPAEARGLVEMVFGVDERPAVESPALRDAQAAGEVRTGNPVLMARSMLLAAHGFVLSAHTMVDDTVSLDELDGELRLALTRGLLP